MKSGSEPTNYLYVRKGLAELQQEIDLAHIWLTTGQPIANNVNITGHQMPFPSITVYNKIQTPRNLDMKYYVVLVILFELLVMLPVIVKRIVEDRQTRITDYLFQMGVQRVDHWFSVIIDALVVIGLQLIIILLILSYDNITYYTDYRRVDTVYSHSLLDGISVPLFVSFSLLFLIQSILFVALISVFFRNPNLAVIVTIIAWIITFAIPIAYTFLFIGKSRPVLSDTGLEVFSCLLPNCALFWFIHICIGLIVNAETGADWAHVFESGYFFDHMNVSQVLAMIVISRDKVWEPMVENEAIIRINNLRKTYKTMFGLKSDTILKGIDFEVKDKTIAVLLGPNGSGKTTLINIITGLIGFKGQVTIGSHHIIREQSLVQNMTGICPQENVYFKYLTIREHLMLFSRLKHAIRDSDDGYSGQHLMLFSRLKHAIRDSDDGYSGQELVRLLSLEKDLNKEAFHLSGGGLRRLVLSMALIGHNDVLVLDEPTAALDPRIRRQVWDLIIASRNAGKTVLITSHDFEEANLLSDQICIISEGMVRFNGSTLEMKKRFNSGYELKVCKSIEMQTESKITAIIGKLVDYSSGESLYNYFHNILFGVSVNISADYKSMDVNVWHNYIAYHSLPISLNLMTNTLLKTLTKDNDYTISVSHEALQEIQRGYDNNFGQRFSAQEIIVGTDYVIFLCVFSFTSAAYTYLMASDLSMTSLYLSFLCYGLAFIPFAYLISFMFTKPSTAFTFISLYNIIVGTVVILIELTASYFRPTFIMKLLTLLAPNVLFLNCIDFLHQILFINTICPAMEREDPLRSYCPKGREFYVYGAKKFCCRPVCNTTTELDFKHYSIYELRVQHFDTNCHQFLNPFDYISAYFIHFLFYGVIYMCIVFTIETKFHKTVYNLMKKYSAIRDDIDVHDLNAIELQEVIESPDLRQEYETVSQLIRSENFDSVSLICDKLTKNLNKKTIIPNEMSFVVNKDQCFGLLGTNGSGKTTTFRLLTGDLEMDSGNAYLGSNADLMANKRQFYSRVGYCPQTDALLDQLTGRQTLVFFGRIRGLQTKALKMFIKNISEKFELKTIIDKRVSTYSGGNRRKLSLAVAVMASPRLLLLDEPTTGVDPSSRLSIWRLLRDLVVSSKTSILLTSHNMIECQTLCDRLAIVSKGVIKTIGFTDELKNRYGKGFDVILKINGETSDEIISTLKSRMHDLFGDKCVEKYSNLCVIYYNLNLDLKLSQIFGSLETLKCELNLEDYLVTNSSLEQTFLAITQTNTTSL
ncbi:unnamed protein product, partial [Medioppia subpectinata]